MLASLLGMAAYPPILRGLAALVVAGSTFPIVGVLIIHMNLITLRFALMHAALLGGAIAVAFGFHPAATTILVGFLCVGVIGRISRRSQEGLGATTTMLMSVAIAGTAALSYRYNVPAQETLAMLWGNIYALRTSDLVTTVCFAVFLPVVTVVFWRALVATMFDPEVASTSDVNEPGVYYGVLFAVALTVSVAMRLVGALMLDVLLILPAMIAARFASSLVSLFVGAMFAGFTCSVAGFILSVSVDIPASTGVAIIGVGLLSLSTLRNRIIFRRRKQ